MVGGRVSKVPAEFGKRPDFAFANREAFKDMAADDAFPRWLRVTFAAYGEVAANGHANFRQQRLAWILGDVENGVVMPTSRQLVREAIDGAIDRGLLLQGSRALCLIVPRHVVGYGIGKALPCKRHPEQRNGQTVSSAHQTTRFQPVVSTTKERQNRVVSGSRPLFSLPTQHTGQPQPDKEAS